MAIFSRILLPLDLSPFSGKAISYTSELMKGHPATATILTVINDVFPYFEFFPVEYAAPDFFEVMKVKAEEELKALVEEHSGGAEFQIVIRRGSPAREIVEMASTEHYDLIVMATHGHTGIEHALLGSITEKVLRKAHCPVLVVR